MTEKKTTLMSELDRAAYDLIKRYFPPAPDIDEKPVEPPDSQDQIKAFDAVVKYYGPRTKLGGDEEKQENGIDALKRKLHGSRAPRRRPRSSESGTNGAASLADDPAGSA